MYVGKIRKTCYNGGADMENEIIPIDNAVMFNMVMSKKENCQGFIERALGIKVANLTILETEKVMEADIDIKGVRLDVYVEDEQGNTFDVEMQANSNYKDYLGRRSRYYQSMMDTTSFRKGKKYYQLSNSYVIFVCTFDPFDEDRKYYTFNNLCRENTALELNDGSTKIFLYPKGTVGTVSKKLEAFLHYVETKEATDEYTKGLDDDVKSFSKDPQRRQAIMTVQDDMDFLNFLHKRELDVKDAIIADKDKEIAEMKQENAEMKQENAEMKQENAEMKAKMAELEAIVKALAAKQ